MIAVWALLACVAGGESGGESAGESGGGESGGGPAGPVVIVGAGAAGLAAAMDLPGAIVLEAGDAPGGRAAISGGVMQFVGTAEQAAAGLDDSAAQAVADWPALTGGPATESTSSWLADSAAVRDRLVGLGVAFTLSDRPDPILGRRRLHVAEGAGAALVAGLLSGVPDSVEVRTGTRVTGLRLAGGAVTGVETDAGPVDASVVVIATGGFANRADLLTQYVSWPAGSWDIGEDAFADGVAMDWAATYGLGVAAPGAVGANADVVGLPGAEGVAVRAPHAAWVWVDEAGARFVDESQGASLTLAVAAEAHAPTWAVAARAELQGAVSAADWAALTAELPCAADAAGLAAATGVDAAGLAATLDAVAAARAAGGEDAFGRPAATLPVLSGELCAFPPGRLASKSFGGLAVGADGQVEDASGAPIAGLYAAGEAAGMGRPGLGGAWGFDGSLSAVVWSGWHVAAAVAAAQ